MPFQNYVDGTILTAAELNSDNANSLDIQTATPQTVVSTVTFGGVKSPALTISGLASFAGAMILELVTVTSGGSYALSANDFYVVVNKTTGSATTISLPANPAIGRLVCIKDGRGDASTNVITIQATPTSNFIDGLSSYQISSNWGSVQLTWAGSRWLSV
jgi:hypothetical protein